MLRNIALVLVCWVFFHMLIQPDYAALYSNLIGFVVDRHTMLLTAGLAGSALLVVLSYVCGTVGFYALMFLLAKAFFELSQLAVCLVSVSSLITWFTIHRNLWIDAPAVIYVLLYCLLGASALALHIFDFNYPLKGKFASHALLPVIAPVLIGVAKLLS